MIHSLNYCNVLLQFSLSGYSKKHFHISNFLLSFIARFYFKKADAIVFCF